MTDTRPWYTYVSRSAVERNKTRGTNEPTLCVQHGFNGDTRRARHVVFPEGAHVEVIQSDVPLVKSGAVVVVQSDKPPFISS